MSHFWADVKNVCWEKPATSFDLTFFYFNLKFI